MNAETTVEDTENKVEENTIEQELKSLIDNNLEPGIILHTDKSVSIEHVVKIMDIAYRNKYKIVLELHKRNGARYIGKNLLKLINAHHQKMQKYLVMLIGLQKKRFSYI